MLTFFSIALSGCSFSKKPATTTTTTNNVVVAWGFEDEDVWKPVIANFQSTNKGLTLKYFKQTFDSDYENRLLNSILSGQGPDVFPIPSDWVFRYKERLAPAPIDAKTKTTGINPDDQYAPAVKDIITYNGKYLALPTSFEPLIVYYNPALFQSAVDAYDNSHKGETFADARKHLDTLLQEPPKNWGDFVEAAEDLTIKNGNVITQSGVAMGTAAIANSQDILYLLMLQNDTRILSEDLKIATFNSPKDTIIDPKNIPGKKAIDFYTSFSNPASANYTWNDSLGDNVQAFANGKVAMIFGYSSLQKTLLQSFPAFKYKKSYAPQLGQEQYPTTDYATFEAYGVSKLSTNIAASWSLVKGLSLNNTLVDTNKSFAPNKQTASDRTSGDSPERSESTTAKAFIKGRYPTKFDQQMRGAINVINLGTQDSKTALDLAAVAITDLLKKEQW